MNIVVLGLKNDNIGDSFIPETTTWLIKEVCARHNYKNINIKQGSFNAFNDNVIEDCKSAFDYRRKNFYNYHFIGIFSEAARFVLFKIMRKLSCRALINMINRIRHFIFIVGINYRHRCKKYFLNKFKDCNLIVFAGGGITEYAYNEFYEYLYVAVKIANKLNIPVVFNAIGNSGKGYDPKDFRCKILIKMFSYQNVKYVSVRDSVSDIQKMIGDRIAVNLVADPAFSISEAYNTKKDHDASLVGIGLIRGNAFLSYYKKPNENQLIKLYVDIANKLMAKGHSIEFFTNGMRIDYEFGKKLINAMKLDNKYLVERPIKTSDLINTLKRYKGIVVGRMHASIAAFSMGIPSIILPWNNKVIKYMQNVGYPNRAIDYSKLNADYIVQEFERSLKEGISPDKISFLKESAKKNVENFLSMFVNK